MDQDFFKKISTTVMMAVLVVLSFLLLKPILLSIFLGIILAFVFAPVFNYINKRVKSKNFSATIISLLLLALIIVPIWLLTPLVLEQAIKVYQTTQNIDYIAPLHNIFPSLFSSDTFTGEVVPIIHSFVSKSINSLVNSMANIILDFPTIMLQLLVVFFTFFFVLRDKEQVLEYVKSLLPFTKDVEKKLFDSSKGITESVVYGQIIIGLIQGLITGIGFFIFGVQNALILTLLAIVFGVFPIVGTGFVWLPVSGYLLLQQNSFAAIGVAVFGLISSTVDNFLRPLFVSRRTQLSSPIVLIGMIGGLFFFGVLGIILGPLILAYLLIILEVYRKGRGPGILSVS